MDYKKLTDALKNLEAIAYGYNINGEVLGMDCGDFESIMVDAADAIGNLLVRAEKAEAERDEARRDCAVAERNHQIEVERRQVAEDREKNLIEAITMVTRRAEMAEEIASDLLDDFTDFVIGGVPNAAPYCGNCRPECVNSRGWCNGDNSVCRGFMPKAAVRKKEE